MKNIKIQVDENQSPGIPSTETKPSPELSADFTPGPWKVRSAEDSGGIELDVMTADGYYVAQAFEMFGVDDRVETLANARLIAAAPALYQIARRFVAIHMSMDSVEAHEWDEEKLVDEARAALALVEKVE